MKVKGIFCLLCFLLLIGNLNCFFSQKDSLFYQIIDGVYINEHKATKRIKCYPYIPKDVQIQLVNKTGFQIDSIHYCDLSVPKLLAYSTSQFYHVSNFKDGSLLYGKIKDLDIANPFLFDDYSPFEYAGKKIIVEITLVDSEWKQGFCSLKMSLVESLGKF